MAHWASLSDVDKMRNAGKSKLFPPSLVYAVNWSARNPFPRKFTYSSCPAESRDGHRCNLSVEFGSKCGHDEPGEPAWRFQIVLVDVVHGPVVPLKVLLWSSASTLLTTTPHDFSLLSEHEHTRRVHAVLHKAPKLQVTLECKSGEIHCQHLSFVNDGTCNLTPTKANFPSSSSSPVPPKSAKKVIRDVLQQLSSIELKD